MPLSCTLATTSAGFFLPAIQYPDRVDRMIVVVETFQISVPTLLPGHVRAALPVRFLPAHRAPANRRRRRTSCGQRTLDRFRQRQESTRIEMQDGREEFWLIWFPCLLAAALITSLYIAARVLS